MSARSLTRGRLAGSRVGYICLWLFQHYYCFLFFIYSFFFFLSSFSCRLIGIYTLSFSLARNAYIQHFTIYIHICIYMFMCVYIFFPLRLFIAAREATVRSSFHLFSRVIICISVYIYWQATAYVYTYTYIHINKYCTWHVEAPLVTLRLVSITNSRVYII